MRPHPKSPSLPFRAKQNQTTLCFTMPDPTTNYALTAVPTNSRQALRHFGVVESDRTPLLRVFGIDDSSATIFAIRKMFRRLSILVHPDKCAFDTRGSERAIKVLSRAIAQAMGERDYASLIDNNDQGDAYEIDHFVLFSTVTTNREYEVRHHEHRIAREEEERAQRAQKHTEHAPQERRTPCSDQEASSNEDEKKRREHEEECEKEQRRRAENLRKQREEEESQENVPPLHHSSTSLDRTYQSSKSHDHPSTARNHAQQPRTNNTPSNAPQQQHTEDCALRSESYYDVSPLEPHSFQSDGDNEDGDNEYSVSDDNSESCFLDIAPSNVAKYIVFDESDSQGQEQDGPDTQRDDHGDDDGRMDEGDKQRDEDGDDDGPDAKKRQAKRKQQKQESKKRYLARLRASLQAEKAAAMSWKPRRCIPISPEVGISLSFRWQCEQYIRAHTAYVGAYKGVNVSTQIERVRMTCKDKECNALMLFNYQPKVGLWKLNKFVDHCNECSGQRVPDAISSPQKSLFCYPAYTPTQIARCVLGDVSEDPNVTTRMISNLVSAQGIYNRQPSINHFRKVRQEVMHMLSASRAVDMAALQGFAELLNRFGYQVNVHTMSADEMRATRVKAAKHIFQQCKKAGSLPKDAMFDDNVVSLSDIKDGFTFYGGFTLVMPVASTYVLKGRKTAAADACHCDGIGPQSYGTLFEVVTYDANNHILPLVFAHFVGSECEEYWTSVFNACKSLPGFDITERTTIVDQEKSIDTAYRKVMERAKLFLDPLHVKKNMGPKLGSEKAVGLSLYERAVRAPSQAEVDNLVAEYPEAQRLYLGKFPKSELYRAYSSLEDMHVTSQGAECEMAASLRNHIRCVEPQKMIHKAILSQRSSFLERQQRAVSHSGPVPPSIEQHIAKLIGKSKVYRSSIVFTAGTNQTEATVRSVTNGSQLRTVKFTEVLNSPPCCCAYSADGTGFPCLHGVSVICEKHGIRNVHKFVDSRHHTAAWKLVYENVTFPVPPQFEVDAVLAKAKRLVLNGDNLQVPKALPPPRGRPVKHAGKRRKGWYERGPNAKKQRSYSCSLCHKEDHTAPNCPLRQLFEPTQ